MRRRRILAGASLLPFLTAGEAGARLPSPETGFGSFPDNLPGLPETAADVVIVGSGAAGLAAAVEARKAGRSVIVLEKMGSIGGNSGISQGLMSVPGTPVQEKLGIDDSPERFAADMLKESYCGHPGRIRLMAEKALETYEWTEKELGVSWKPDHLEKEIEASVARAAVIGSGSGAGLIIPLYERARALGARFEVGMKVERIVTSPKGVVLGVLARNVRSGALMRFRARYGVVLAAGGFGADIDFREFCNPRLSERVGTTTQPGSTAEVLRAASKIGAWIIHLQYISCIPDANPDEKGWGTGWQFTRYCAGAQGIWVERKTGKRFTNEMGSSVDCTNAVFDALRREHDLIAIADARAVRHPRSGIFTEEDVKTLVARGYVTEFETLESLAEELEMPLESLRQEIAAYSQAVLKGDSYDRMGRRIEKGAEPMGEAPWYAAPLTAKVLSCSGGIAIDLKARVLSVEDDQPIPHLYAAGEITGGLHGVGYLGSCGLLDALVFGRIVGREAAKSEKDQTEDSALF